MLLSADRLSSLFEVNRSSLQLRSWFLLGLSIDRNASIESFPSFWLCFFYYFGLGLLSSDLGPLSRQVI